MRRATAPTSRICAIRSLIADVSEVVPGLGVQGVRAGARGRRSAGCGRSRRRAAATARFFDRMNAWAQGEGAPGLGYIFWREGEDGGAGPIAKILGPERTARPRVRARAAGRLAGGDAVVLRAAADGLQAGEPCSSCRRPATMAKFAGSRERIAEELGLIARRCYRFAWVVDFPMYEWDEQTKSVDLLAQPVLDAAGRARGARDQGSARDHWPTSTTSSATASSCSSGAIRNHRPDIMVKAFAIAGYGQDVLEARFGGMFRALHYGAPPHGGIAPGIDRIVMLIARSRRTCARSRPSRSISRPRSWCSARRAPVDDKQLKRAPPPALARRARAAARGTGRPAGDTGSRGQRSLTLGAARPRGVVGAAGIEPATPTMST